MRHIQIAFLVVLGLGIEASASPRPGGGSGGTRGRLGQVSGGIATATSSGRGGGGGQSTRSQAWDVPCEGTQYRRRLYDGQCVRQCPTDQLYRPDEGACVRRTIAVVDAPDAMLEADAIAGPSPSDGGARLTGYLGGQKVFDSDGAITLDLALSDRWFRVAGSLTRFFERQPGRNALTMTMPSLAFGVRLDDSSTTRIYLEAGVAAAITRNDPTMDSTINGVLGGVSAEHSISKRTTLIGNARLAGFQDDIRAASLRAGVRYGHVQASLSIVDFNVGPALFGPELGIGF